MPPPKTIAIDYDDTYSADPPMWDDFIINAKDRGHRVICVTCRHPSEENRELCDVFGILTYFTRGAAKDWFLNSIGITVDIWIDDDINSIMNGV